MLLFMIELSGSPFQAMAEVLGTFAFAVSGATAAIRNRYDIFGILVLAFATAIGGGTIRDMLGVRTAMTIFQRKRASARIEWIRILKDSDRIPENAPGPLSGLNKLLNQ